MADFQPHQDIVHCGVAFHTAQFAIEELESELDPGAITLLHFDTICRTVIYES